MTEPSDTSEGLRDRWRREQNAIDIDKARRDGDSDKIKRWETLDELLHPQKYMKHPPDIR